MRLRVRWRLALLFFVLGGLGAFAEQRPILSLPLTCEPHKTCFIQNYVDIDPGPGVKDYGCGTATYDQHSGVDFRLLSAAATKSSVPVLAAADGTVTGVRDGVPDVFFRTAKSKDVSGRECGNGVIIDHGDGWKTQYCHMRQGSVHVAKGQSVRRGEQLGEVGFSGMADFAQVHLTVRHNGTIVDPFLPDSVNGACDKNAKGPGLWEPSAAAAFPYKNGELIAAEFAGAAPDADALEIDDRDIAALTSDSKTLVLYGRFINLLKGDRVHFVASGPRGELFDEQAPPLARNKATFVAFTGKRRDGDPWPSGTYNGRVELIRDGGVIGTSLTAYELK